MDVSVVVCTYNRCELLRHALRALASATVPPNLAWEVVIVDNNSTDGTRNVVDEFARRAPCEVVYVLETRLGKSFALNTGVARARGEILAFTDDDAVAGGDWLTAIVQGFADQSCIGIGGRIVQTWPGGKPAWLESLEQSYPPMHVLAIFDLGDAPQDCTMKTPPYGANVAFRREVFQRCGGFRTDLGPRGERDRIMSEDTEFCRRVIASGERIVYLPSVVVEHPVNQARATKAYFLKWYFNYGRSCIRKGRDREQGVMAVTRCVRALAAGLYRWTLAQSPAERLSRKLSVYQRFGELVETLRQPTQALRNAAPDTPAS